MKTFLFVRGINCPLRKEFVSELMKLLNPNVNTVRAIKISINDVVKDFSDKGQVKAANKDCKNMTRRILMGSHEEEFIVIDNENLQPTNWLSYFRLANDLAPDTLAWGVDIYPVDGKENNFSKEENKKINVQRQNLDMFISSIHKYWCVKNFEDLPTVLTSIQQQLKKGD